MKEIKLTKGKVALVDDDNYDWLAQYSWYASFSGHWYAVTNVRLAGKKKKVYMHRMISGAKDPKTEIDHIDGDGLNNTRTNLRQATRSENMRNRSNQRNNTSGWKGVYKGDKKFRAQIGIHRKSMHLGTFDTPEDAAAAYDRAARELHGVFSLTNSSETE